jgi:3-oxoadipate enol-lactonase
VIASAPPTPLVLPLEMKKQQLLAYNSPQSAEFVIRNILSSARLENEVVSMLIEDMTRGNESAKAAWPSYGMAENILEDAEKIDVQILIIAGSKDRVEPVERLRREVVEILDGSEMVVVEDSGHLLPVEAPVEVARLVRVFVEQITKYDMQRRMTLRCTDFS